MGFKEFTRHLRSGPQVVNAVVVNPVWHEQTPAPTYTVHLMSTPGTGDSSCITSVVGLLCLPHLFVFIRASSEVAVPLSIWDN